jgi:4-amino-4-deoxy-L-arabinose transferase-like glycosyltransferase
LFPIPTESVPQGPPRPSAGRWHAIIVACLILAFLPLYLRGYDRPLGNGDEAVYAELARGMARTGDWATPRWQGRPVFNRPPASLWPLALAMKVAGPGPAVVHAVGAVQALGIVLLVYALTALLWTRSTGLLAALLAGSATLHLLYARTVVADNLLVFFTLASFLAWELGRRQRRWLLLWGLCLGLALLTKQILGFLPLAAPLADLLGRRRLDRRHVGLALFLGLALAGLWLATETMRFGPAFLREHLWLNVWERARVPMIEQTTPSFYVRMLLALESPLILLSLLGMVMLVLSRAFLLPVWGLGCLLALSLSATRFNYYALLFYPALACSTAVVLMGLTPAAPWPRPLPWLRLALPWAVLALWLVVHLTKPGVLRPMAPMDPEPGWLAEQMGRASQPDDPLFLVGLNPYSARYYADRRTIQLVPRRSSAAVSTTVLEAERWPTDDVAATLRTQPRWYAIVRKDQAALLRGLEDVNMVAQTPSLVLLNGQAPRPSP